MTGALHATPRGGKIAVRVEVKDTGAGIAGDARRETVRVGDREIGPGDRVRLRPRGQADAFDALLAGKAATVLSIERDLDGRTWVTVTVDDDPGRDLGATGKPGHRFFFGVHEVEPLAPGPGAEVR